MSADGGTWAHGDDAAGRVWEPGGPLDLSATIGPLAHGPRDPAFQVTPDGAHWWASWTPDGPGTVRIARGSTGSDPHRPVIAQAWGTGAAWLLDGVPELLGARDDRRGFEPTAHPLVAELDHRFPGLRVTRTRRVFEAAVAAVLGQKVTGREAFDSWQVLVRRHGTPAPGPEPVREVGRGAGTRPALVVPPSPATWRRLAQHDLLAANVTPERARTLRAVVVVAESLERTVVDGRAFGDVDRALQSVPGIGPWTSAEIRQRAHGDADAVSVGDFHLANDVCWALTGERGDDAQMLRLMQPWLGHRYRIQRLLEVGHVSAPRRGPRYSPPAHRRLPGA